MSRFHIRSPVDFGNANTETWLLHLIEQRQLSASCINLAINALRSFYGAHLGRGIEPLLTVYGCGLRLSEATHIRIEDIDSARLQLRVSNPDGGRQSMVPARRIHAVGREVTAQHFLSQAEE